MANSPDRSPDQRIVVTGWGMVTPLGGSVEETWEACAAGRSGVRELTRWDATGLPTRIGGEVHDEWITAHDPLGRDAGATRPHRLLLTAARQAAAGADLAAFPDRTRVAVVVGGHAGSPPVADIERTTRHGRDDGSVDAAGLATEADYDVRLFHLRRCDHAPAVVAHDLHARGRAVGIVSACAASAQAIGEATRLLREGRADAVVAGGVEAHLDYAGYVGFALLGALAKKYPSPEKASRPFDRRRSGFVMSEGAAVVVLETLASARARGRTRARRGARLRRERRRVPHHRRPPRGQGRHPRDDARARRRRPPPRGRPVRQRARHLDRDQRPGRDARLEEGARRRARQAGAGVVEQVDARPHDRGRGRRRGDPHVEGHAGGRAAAHDQLRGPRPEVRPRLRPQRGPQDGPRRGAVELVRVRRPERVRCAWAPPEWRAEVGPRVAVDGRGGGDRARRGAREHARGAARRRDRGGADRGLRRRGPARVRRRAPPRRPRRGRRRRRPHAHSDAARPPPRARGPRRARRAPARRRSRATRSASTSRSGWSTASPRRWPPRSRRAARARARSTSRASSPQGFRSIHPHWPLADAQQRRGRPGGRRPRRARRQPRPVVGGRRRGPGDLRGRWRRSASGACGAALCAGVVGGACRRRRCYAPRCAGQPGLVARRGGGGAVPRVGGLGRRARRCPCRLPPRRGLRVRTGRRSGRAPTPTRSTAPPGRRSRTRARRADDVGLVLVEGTGAAEAEVRRALFGARRGEVAVVAPAVALGDLRSGAAAVACRARLRDPLGGQGARR